MMLYVGPGQMQRLTESEVYSPGAMRRSCLSSGTSTGGFIWKLADLRQPCGQSPCMTGEPGEKTVRNRTCVMSADGISERFHPARTMRAVLGCPSQSQPRAPPLHVHISSSSLAYSGPYLVLQMVARPSASSAVPGHTRSNLPCLLRERLSRTSAPALLPGLSSGHLGLRVTEHDQRLWAAFKHRQTTTSKYGVQIRPQCSGCRTVRVM
ncbi:hypothetical protein C8Q80DRAFT_748002 [Daedaleopsis nitida]|nr:hypothetical protein C8Q80DRAFT_748002 [Daedaleopsis nitida]